MGPIPQTWQDTWAVSWTYTIAQFSTYLPKLLGALVVFLVGLVAARIVKGIVVKALETIRIHKAIEKTPVELFLKNAEMGQKLETVIGGVVYWILVLVVIHTSVSLLGLTPLSNFFEQLFGYLPHVLTAFLIFIFGVLLAGVVESVIKGTLRSVDAHSARLFAKMSSYVVVAIASLAAIAELGIARDFILILFIGVVSALSIGSGLALGLGGQDTIRKIMEKWYNRTK